MIKYSKEELMAMYKTMVQSRIFDTEMDRSNKQGRLQGMFHFGLNEEAIGTAVVHGLHDDEPFMPQHRDRPLYLARVDMQAFIDEMVGLKTGIHGGIVGDFHVGVPEKGMLFNPSVLGTGCPIATGYAYIYKRKNPGKAMIQCMGDGTFAQGVVHESLNWAVIQKLPIVYVVECNGFAMSSTPSIYGENVADRARAVGMDAVVVDGNDLMAMREVVDIALERARTQSLPTLIEAHTYRIGGHFAGDPAGYRDEEYHQEMMKRYPDPIPRYEKVLIENGIATQEELDAIKKTIKKEIRARLEETYQRSLDPANRPVVEQALDLNRIWAMPMEGLK